MIVQLGVCRYLLVAVRNSGFERPKIVPSSHTHGQGVNQEKEFGIINKRRSSAASAARLVSTSIIWKNIISSSLSIVYCATIKQ